MQIESILTQIEQRKFAPIYFLMGEESFYIDQITNALEDTVLTADEKSFNQVIVYGKETTIEDVLSYAKQYPMMSTHTLVIVKEAQHLSRTIDKLETYLKEPLSSTILVFCYKNARLDKRKSLTKNLDKNHVLFDSKKLYDNQLPQWIDTHVRNKNRTITDKAKYLLVESIGNDLSRMHNELNKLYDLLPKAITEEAIEKNIGLSKDFNNFELQNAIISKNIVKANTIIKYFSANPKDHPIVVTISILYTLYSNLIIYHSLADKSKMAVASALGINPYFVADYQKAGQIYPLKKVVQGISHLRKADLQSKGIGASNMAPGEILKELIFKLMH